MKKSLILWAWILPLFTFGQMTYPIPQVGSETSFAGITLRLSPRVQQMVNTEINNLLRPNVYLNQQLERMQLYFPVIESVFQKEDLPTDFKYIAVLESNLMANAVSESKAEGYWQFKEGTAKELGLVINSYVDERRHIGLSSQAAAAYLKRSQLVYRNWVSSLLSYFYGLAGVTKVIPSSWSGAKEIELTETTDRYLVKAIAYKEAFEHRLDRIPDSMFSLVTLETNGRSLDEIAQQLLLDPSQLGEYNQWLISPSIPTDKNYLVYIRASIQDAARIRLQGNERLAKGNAAGTFPQLKRMTPTNIGPDEPIFYEINGKKGILASPGDEVAQLAAKGKVSIKAFLSYNDLTDRDMVKAGNIYYLQKKKGKGPIAFHTVLENQTLWDISQIYGVQLKKLMVFNRLDNARYVQKGRVLYLQGKRPKKKPIEIIEEGPKEIPATQPVLNQVPTETVTSTPTKPIVEEEEEVEVVNVDVTVPVKTSPTVVSQPTTPPNTTVVVPPKKEENKAVNTTVIPVPTSVVKPIPANGVHRVGQGESLYSIARMYNLKQEDLMVWNNLSSVAVQYDQVIRLSAPPILPAKTSGISPAITTEVPSSSSEAPAKTHLVAAKETLFSISKQYGLTVADLQQLNGLPDNTIKVGQTLVVEKKITSGIPAGYPTKVYPGKFHKVEKGDTLFNISKRYGLTVDELKEMNGLVNETISLGQELKVRK